MKRFLKIATILMALLLLTCCAKSHKEASSYTEKTINLSKNINCVSDIKYLGKDIYAVNTSKDKDLIKYKLMDSNGNLINDTTFWDVNPDLNFNDKKSIPVMVRNSKYTQFKYRLINMKGEFLGKSYDFMFPMEKNIYEVIEGNTYGYIDSTGKEITSLIKLSSIILNDPNCRPFKDKNGKYQFLNKEGKNIAPCEFDDFKYIRSSKDLIPVYKNHKWGFINKKGVIVKDFQFEDVNGFSKDLISVKENGKWGCMDQNLNITIPFKFDKPVIFIKGIAIANMDSKEGAIDKKGNFLIYPKFDSIKGNFNEGYSTAKLGNKTGVIDIKGNFIVEPNNIYSSYSWDSKSIIMVTNSGTTNLMDIKSKKIINLDHKQFINFKDNIIIISENNKWGIIDRQGNTIASPEFDEFINFKKDYAIVRKQNKYGVIDTKGKYKIPLKYDEIKYISNNYYAVKKDNTWGIIDINDKVIKPFQYNNSVVVEHKKNNTTEVYLIKDKKVLVLNFKN